MTNDPANIDKALRTAVIALLGTTPYAAEGIVFDPPQTGVYCELTNLPGLVFAATLGSGGEDEHVGLYQVDVVQPKIEGTKATDAIVSALYQAFPIGKGMQFNNQAVIVSGFQRSGRRTDGTRNRVAVSIYWRAHLTRTPV